MTILIWSLIGIFGLFAFVVFFGAPYVPVKRRDAQEAFDDLYPIKPTDVLVDLGSGDGKVLREVSQRGGRAVGIELNPLLVLLSKVLLKGDRRVEVRLGDYRRAYFPREATVVYIFGTSRDIGRLAQKVESEASRLDRSLCVLSYGFELPGRQPIKRNKHHFLYEIQPLQPDKHKV